PARWPVCRNRPAASDLISHARSANTKGCLTGSLFISDFSRAAIDQSADNKKSCISKKLKTILQQEKKVRPCLCLLQSWSKISVTEFIRRSATKA
uniref:hypothetical protein n=1 Tax=Candidatus Electronema sp. TaxID=2698783 RepID=UPI004056AB9B